MSQEAASSFYTPNYYRGGDYADYVADEKVLKKNFRSVVQNLLKLQPTGTLLEVGCAYGYFLDLARAHWKVTGVDISAEAVTSASVRLPASVHQGDLTSLPLPSSYFNVAVTLDTFEHVDQPRAYAARIFDLLMPGGHLVLTTGDVSSPFARLCGSRWRLLTPPSHLSFFSRAGMNRMLTDHGFREIRFETTGYHRSLKFTLFRLFGADRTGRLPPWLKNGTYYLNLGDIMRVSARKPDRPSSLHL